MTISLLDDQHEKVTSWRVSRAMPVKFCAQAPEATGDAVAIESIELAHEGVAIVRG